MKTYTNILCGVHFREPDTEGSEELTTDAKEAVERALQLAAAGKAKLTFCHVFPLDAHLWDSVDVESRNRMVRGIRGELDRLVAEAKTSGIDAQWDLRFGKPWLELVRAVQSEGFDLVCVGNRKRHGMGRVMLGSESTQLVLHCPCPVWVVHVTPRTHRRILAATDLSETGAEVIRAALCYASGIRHSIENVDVLHIVDTWIPSRTQRVGAALSVIEHEHELLVSEAKNLLAQQVAAVCDDLGIRDRPEMIVVSGEADRMLWQECTSTDVELLVIGVVGRTGWKGFVIGNTALKLLPELPNSVLAVKPRDFAVRV